MFEFSRLRRNTAELSVQSFGLLKRSKFFLRNEKTIVALEEVGDD